MSDFYNLSIIILVCTKNTVYLCKQTTGQIDGAMIAFLGCKFAGSPLSEEFPGELGGRRGKRGGKSQAGFFLRASLRFSPPRDCKAGCIGDNPTFSDPPPHLWPAWKRPGHYFFSYWWWSLLFPCLPLPSSSWLWAALSGLPHPSFWPSVRWGALPGPVGGHLSCVCHR